MYPTSSVKLYFVLAGSNTPPTIVSGVSSSSGCNPRTPGTCGTTRPGRQLWVSPAAENNLPGLGHHHNVSRSVPLSWTPPVEQYRHCILLHAEHASVGDPNCLYSGQQIGSCIDMELILGWVHTCEDTHARSCRPDQLDIDSTLEMPSFFVRNSKKDMPEMLNGIRFASAVT
jgi:hypothetical protein